MRGTAAAAWLARRLAAAAAIVFAVVTLTFVIVHLAPGSPFLPGPDHPADPRLIAELTHRFGLDQPLSTQYLRYLGRLLHGDFGYAFSQGVEVRAALGAVIPNTLLLAGTALVLDLLGGLGLALVQAARARRFTDVALGNATLFVYSVPTFWLGLVLVFVFSIWLRWLPPTGTTTPGLYESLPLLGRIGDRLLHLVLPACTLGLVGAAGTARYQRAALLETLGRDFIRTARAKGLADRRILLGHALRNALLPFITLLGISLPFLLTGAVLVEDVFAWPGMGRLAMDAVLARDHTLVTAVAIVTSTLVVLGSLVADVLYAVADPRIRSGTP